MASESTPAAREILYYRNPMGLPDTSPVPKKDSMGMDYLPVYADQTPVAPGTVVLAPEKVQKLGVRTALVEQVTLPLRVRASATVEVDETRERVIAPRFAGWIETLHANQTGMPVRRGQPLAILYSPELIAAQEEARIAVEAAARLAAGDPASAVLMRQLGEAARTRLRNWQVSGAGLDRRGNGRLALTAPVDAVVIEKPVVQGDRFVPGQTILRLADLSRVWVVANLPASQSAGIAVGDRASFATPALPGRHFDGEVGFIQPLLDRSSRSVGVRIELANPDGDLRPGLFGDVDITGASQEPMVVVPESAVIDSGTRQIALVAVGGGRYEPRALRLGRHSDRQVAVLDGLREGEQVVVAANFLIDAESQLGAALHDFAPAAAEPQRADEHAVRARPDPAPSQADRDADAAHPTRESHDGASADGSAVEAAGHAAHFTAPAESQAGHAEEH